MPRAAECRNRDVLPLNLLRQPEELLVLGIGTRIPAFHVVHAQFVQPPGDLELVRGREGKPLGLRAVPQRRIVDDDAALGLRRLRR